MEKGSFQHRGAMSRPRWLDVATDIGYYAAMMGSVAFGAAALFMFLAGMAVLLIAWGVI